MASPRSAALALCLLALAASASAACMGGYIKLDLLTATSYTHIISRCMTSIQINVEAMTCRVSITPLNPPGNFVTGDWASPADYVECPAVESLKLTPVSADMPGVLLLIQLSFEGFVFGFINTAGAPNKMMPLTVSYETVGTISVIVAAVVTPATLANTLTYAVTDFTVAQTDVDPALAIPTTCGGLPAGTCWEGGSSTGVATECNPGRYGTTLNSVGICSVCPAGTSGDGSGCTPCTSGTTSLGAGSPT